jgi:hypothetical protein
MGNNPNTQVTGKNRKHCIIAILSICVVLIAAVLIILKQNEKKQQAVQVAIVEDMIGSAYRDWTGSRNQIAGIYYFMDEENYVYVSLNTEDGNRLEEPGKWRVVGIRNGVLEIQVDNWRENRTWESLYIWFSEENGMISADSVRISDSIYVKISDDLVKELFPEQ